MRIGLVDFDGKIPNLALMKLSTYYKQQGAKVFLNEFPRDVDKVYCSVLFTWNKEKALILRDVYKNIEFGGTGWDITKHLPPEVEKCNPDYELYQMKDIYKRLGGIMKKETKIKKAKTLLNMGIGFTSRGCIRNCGFCFVPEKEGKFKQVADIKDLINPKSNVITLLDNNFTADPDMIDKCKEIKERDLIVDISQGIDVRLLTEEKAKALSEIKHLRSIHYAWDLMSFENSIIEGIKLLSKYIKPWKHMCFMLVGFNTSFEEDMYRFRRLVEMNVDPYVMIYNKKGDARLKHFARWVNGRIYKVCEWNEYEPWKKAQRQLSFA
ncbi:radical SAM protein [Caloranaerobacter ferrireducens]|uniref:radical SAM protein n=1 Tax=Caloranaerobacter ferrireducens TaxID=1323370 RepID=UPI00084DC206|nr:radical SAM protein [Caloranaerobacter ferrireducens]